MAGTPVTATLDASPQSIAAAVTRHEAMLKGLVLPEGADLGAVIAGLNRIYRMTIKGSTGTPSDAISYDMSDDDLQYVGMDSSVHMLVIGSFIGDYGLTVTPFVERVLGGDESGDRTDRGSLLHLTLGPTPYSFEEDGESLAEKTFGSQSLIDTMLDGPDALGSSILAYIQALKNQHDLELTSLRMRVAALESA